MDAVRNDQIATLIEQRQEFDRKQLDKATNDFRNMHQQPCGRREFDLLVINKKNILYFKLF